MIPLMRTCVWFFLVALLWTAPAAAQGNKIKEDLVPESVLNAYHEKYKKRHVRTWYEEEHGYSCVFEKGDAKPQAYFKTDGTWIKTTLKIKESAVSGQVKKAIRNTQWSEWKTTERFRVETPESPKLFELHMKKGKETKVLVFDPTGKALDID